MAETLTTPKRKRGRKATVGRWYSLEEVSALCRWDAATLLRTLETMPELLTDWECVDGVWQVPGRALLSFLLPFGLEQRCTVLEAARALRVPRSTIYGWIDLEGPAGANGEPVRLLPSERKLYGVRLLLRDVLALPERPPAWVPVSFFARRDQEDVVS